MVGDGRQQQLRETWIRKAGRPEVFWRKESVSMARSGELDTFTRKYSGRMDCLAAFLISCVFRDRRNSMI